MWNPLSWIKILTLVKDIGGLIQKAVGSISDWIKKSKIQKTKEKVREAVQKYKDANTVENNQERIEAKVDALCKIEKIGNPDSDCDADPGNGELPGPKPEGPGPSV